VTAPVGGPGALPVPERPASISVGTSGYNYDAWKGKFYPARFPNAKMLAYYASVFSSVEINSSYYRKPTEQLLAGWAAQVPPAFSFALKAWQRITEGQRLRNCAALVASFCGAARTLGPRLGPLLFKIPVDLPADQGLLRDFLGLLPRDLRAAFDFRSPSWHSEQTFQALRDAGCSLCLTDSEELQTPIVQTASWGYFRLRRDGYDGPALARWTASARAFPGGAFVYFRHEDEARGPRFAREFAQLLEQPA